MNAMLRSPFILALLSRRSCRRQLRWDWRGEPLRPRSASKIGEPKISQEGIFVWRCGSRRPLSSTGKRAEKTGRPLRASRRQTADAKVLKAKGKSFRLFIRSLRTSIALRWPRDGAALRTGAMKARWGQIAWEVVIWHKKAEKKMRYGIHFLNGCAIIEALRVDWVGIFD